MNAPIEGGCHCGALRFRVDAPLAYASYCHCRMCQRTMGSPAGIFAGPVTSNEFRYTSGTPVVYVSSGKAQREFCGTCGAQLVFRRRDKDKVSVNIVTLDDPSLIEPTVHIWTESRISWFDTTDTHGRRKQARS